MSIPVIKWAFEADCPSPTAKLVLLKLAYHANFDGECWPSQTVIAEGCGIPRESVNRQVKALADAGLIRVEQRIGAGKLPNRYILLCDAGSHRCDVRSHPEAVLEQSDVTSDHSRCDVTSHKPLREPLREVGKEADASFPGTQEPRHVGSRGRGTRLSQAWRPDPEGVAFALGLGLDAGTLADEFADYWCAVPGARGVKLDWPATWRNWCRRAQPAASNGNARSRGGRPGVGSIAAALARVHLPRGGAGVD